MCKELVFESEHQNGDVFILKAQKQVRPFANKIIERELSGPFSNPYTTPTIPLRYQLSSVFSHVLNHYDPPTMASVHPTLSINFNLHSMEYKVLSFLSSFSLFLSLALVTSSRESRFDKADS
ncbi:hypothetical protein Droror1_Dr00017164 [Drosera rotundifolia]